MADSTCDGLSFAWKPLGLVRLQFAAIEITRMSNPVVYRVHRGSCVGYVAFDDGVGDLKTTMLFVDFINNGPDLGEWSVLLNGRNTYSRSFFGLFNFPPCLSPRIAVSCRIGIQGFFVKNLVPPIVFTQILSTIYYPLRNSMLHANCRNRRNLVANTSDCCTFLVHSFVCDQYLHQIYLDWRF